MFGRPPHHYHARPAGTRPAGRPGAPPAKSTTLWVGKIAPTLDSSTILALLNACGPVKEWKPAIDPTNGAIKGFGFCTFQRAESVLAAVEILNGLEVDGMELSLKGNTATQTYIDWFKSSQTSSQTEGESENTGVAELLAAAKVKIAELVAARPQVSQSAAAAADEFLTSMGLDAKTIEASAHDYGMHPSKVAERKRARDDTGDHSPERARKRTERKSDPIWQRWDAQLRRKLDDAEVLAKDLRRQVERREREKRREKERQSDREGDLLVERQRQIQSDNIVPDSDEDEAPWARRTYRNTRRAAERRRRVERELEEDRADKGREKELKEVQVAEEADFAEKFAVSSHDIGAESVAVHQERSPAPVDKALEPAVLPEVLDAQKASRAVPRVLDAFVEEEEGREAGQRLGPMPIQYSDQELRGGTANESGEAPSAPPQQVPAPPLSPEKIKRQLMATIPKDRSGVFAYPIKWHQLDDAPQEVKARISGWISKKIADLMGEEEPSFCEFIMAQVAAKQSANELLEKLRDVLDEDADSFVMKLFQVLIFESEKLSFAASAT
jgi:RNA-binding protein 25